jgi:tRNA(adenine34) deaminase
MRRQPVLGYNRLMIESLTNSTNAAEDERYMRHALALARHAQAQGEVPVGAVLVRAGEIIGAGWNQPIAAHDPSAHAEVMALRAAGQQMANYRLPGTILYVTLEPCLMCVGALVQARVAQVVYGAADPKGGAVHSVYPLLTDNRLNHRAAARGGVLAADCAQLLQDFFQMRRQAAKTRE